MVENLKWLMASKCKFIGSKWQKKIKLIKKNDNLPNLRGIIYSCQNKMFQKGKENAKEKDVTNSTDSQPIHIYNFKVNNVIYTGFQEYFSA